MTQPNRAGAAEKVAARAGVSVRTVYRAARFADAVDLIAEVYGPGARADILAGKYGQRQTLRVAEEIRAGRLP